MPHPIKFKLLAACIACFAFAQLSFADMVVRQNRGVVTITDSGSNPDGSFTIAVNRNNALIVRTSNGNATGTVTRAFDASTVQQLRLFTGAGNDQVVVRTAINVAGNQTVQSFPNIDVQIQTGNGDDRVQITGADIGSLSISTGSDDDVVRITTASVINDDLTVLSGAGNDDVFLDTVEVFGSTEVLTGSGNDTFETLRSLFAFEVDVDTGPSMDQISIGGPSPITNRKNYFMGPLRVNGGPASDLINVDNGDYPFFTRFDGGTGLDCFVPYGTFGFDSKFRLFDINTCRPDFPYGSHHIYKTVDGQDLEMILVKPEDWEPNDRRPAILFFHGGSWITGTPRQFADQAKYFAKQGLVCVLVQYRLLDRNIRDEPPVICIRDAKSAMRFVRTNAAMLGIDPDRVASSGASAGGHLAAFLGTTDGIDDPQDDLTVSARPNAMCLFCPAYDNGPDGILRFRFGNRYRELSPAHNISADDAPNIVFLGSADQVIPADTVSRFRRRMLAAGVVSELRIYEGGDHGFFRRISNDGVFYRNTLSAMHNFLGGLGWIEGPPSAADF